MKKGINMNRTLKTVFFVVPKVFTGGETKAIFLKSNFTKNVTKGIMPLVFQGIGEERLKVGFGQFVGVFHGTILDGIYRNYL